MWTAALPDAAPPARPLRANPTVAQVRRHAPRPRLHLNWGLIAALAATAAFWVGGAIAAANL